MNKSKDTCHPRKINKKNACHDINIPQIGQRQNKHKNILCSMNPIVLLTDCLMSDSECIEYVPLRYRIVRNKFVSERSVMPKKEQPRDNKKSVSINLSEDKTKMNNLIETNVITHMNNKGIENIGSGHRAAKCRSRQRYRGYQNGKTLKASRKKTTRYDQNSNIIGLSSDSETLQKNMLIQSIDTNVNKCISSDKRLIENAVPKNDNYENKVATLDHGTKCKVKLVSNAWHEGSKEFTDYKEAPKLGIVHSQEGRSVMYPKLSSTIAKGKSFENVHALKQKDADTFQDISNNVTKRVKLNRNHYLVCSETKCKESNVSDATKHVSFQLNIHEVLSGTVNSDTDKSNTVALATNDGDMQPTDTKLKADNSTLNFAQQNKVNSSRNIDELDGNSLQHTVQSEVAAINDHDKMNGTKAEIMNADDDSDCISLCAASSLMQEYDSYSDIYSEKSFQMTDTVIETYCSKIQTDFNEMYTNLNDNGESGIFTVMMESSRSKESASMTIDDLNLQEKFPENAQVSSMAKTTTDSKKVSLFTKVFRGYCYKIIRTGRHCRSRQCRYKHNFLPRLLYFYYHAKQYFFKIVSELAMRKYTKFLTYVCLTLLRIIDYNVNINCALQIFKKLYKLKVVTEKQAICIVKCMKQSGLSIKEISDRLAKIVNSRDTNFVNWIWKVLKTYVNEGEFWDTFRSLLVKVHNLDLEIIETILQECMITQNHFRDINNTIMRNLKSVHCLKISAQLLLSFKNLVKRGSESRTVDEASANSSNGIRSPGYTADVLGNALNTDKYWGILSKGDRTLKRNKKNLNDDAHIKRSNFTLHPIDDLPKPYSVHGRFRFWKLYVDAYSLQEGLKHDDCDHVLKILNSKTNHQRSFFTRACHKILLNEIKSSPYRLNKLMSHSGNA